MARGHDVLIYAVHIILRQFAKRSPRDLKPEPNNTSLCKSSGFQPVVSRPLGIGRVPSEGSPGGNRESRAAAGRFKRAAVTGAGLGLPNCKLKISISGIFYFLTLFFFFLVPVLSTLRLQPLCL